MKMMMMVIMKLLSHSIREMTSALVLDIIQYTEPFTIHATGSSQQSENYAKLAKQ